MRTKHKYNLRVKRKIDKALSSLMWGGILIVSLLSFSLLANLLQARQNLSQPVSAYLVLGGSIMREIHTAQLVRLQPDMPVIISTGSDEPCIFFIFEREQANMDNVWLEKCADSTLTNFVFSIPIMKQWGAKKVKVITTETHLPRAFFLSHILLNSQGLAVDLEAIPEQEGVSANVEKDWKTFLDITRSLGWALISQLISVPCDNLIKLTDINLSKWYERGFHCETRAKLKIIKPKVN